MTIARAFLAALLGTACLSGAALAQDGATPRAIPEGFVLPGPPPTNAPAHGVGIAPGVVPGAGPVDPSGTVTSQGGALAPGQSTVVGPAGTVQNPMAYAKAPEKGTTNWPCVQRRIESIEPAQVWSGPALSAAGGTPRTREMRALLGELALRRVPLPEAQGAAKAFLEALPEPERGPTATALFADLFERLNAERTQVMRGIERYGARQKALAEAIRKENADLARRRSQNAAVDPQMQQAMEKAAWDTRIFNERRQSLSFVCEVPTLIEQRLFAIGRTLSAGL